MKKRRLILLGIAGISSLTLLSCFLFGNRFSLRPQPIHVFLENQLRRNWSGTRSDPAALAIRQLGTNVLPQLVNELSVQPIPYETKLVEWQRRTKLPFFPSKTAAHRQYLAISAFFAFGEEAKPAVPALTRLLAHRNWKVRTGTVHSLGNIGPVAGEAVPALTVLLQDSEPNVRVQAALALAQIGTGTEQSVPALISSLSDSNLNVKKATISALMILGEKAKMAVPALSSLMTNPDPSVVHNATVALKMIDPNFVPRSSALDAKQT